MENIDSKRKQNMKKIVKGGIRIVFIIIDYLV